MTTITENKTQIPRKKSKPKFMTLTDIFSNNSILKRYYFKTLIVIGLVWTFFDYSRFLTLSLTEKTGEYPFTQSDEGLFVIRIVLALLAYSFMAYLLIFPLKNKFRKHPLWLSFILKTLVLCLLTAVYAVLNFYVIYIFVYGENPFSATRSLYHYALETTWL